MKKILTNEHRYDNLEAGGNMKIVKYKKLKNDKYEITLENNQILELYEDTILKYELLLKKEIGSNLVNILDYDKTCEVYDVAVRYLKIKAHSKYEVYEYLISKDYPKDKIEEVVNKLQTQGYINDLVYAKSFLHQKLITTSNGPAKIKMELLKKKIDLSIVDTALEEYDLATQLEKIKKIMTRMVKSNRNKSNAMLKKKMVTDLTIQGFSKKYIESVMNEIEFFSDETIKQKEYEKLYKKLSKKYSGAELELQLKQKLYQKGFYDN